MKYFHWGHTKVISVLLMIKLASSCYSFHDSTPRMHPRCPHWLDGKRGARAIFDASWPVAGWECIPLGFPLIITTCRLTIDVTTDNFWCNSAHARKHHLVAPCAVMTSHAAIRACFTQTTQLMLLVKSYQYIQLVMIHFAVSLDLPNFLEAPALTLAFYILNERFWRRGVARLYDDKIIEKNPSTD